MNTRASQIHLDKYERQHLVFSSAHGSQMHHPFLLMCSMWSVYKRQKKKDKIPHFYRINMQGHFDLTS